MRLTRWWTTSSRPPRRSSATSRTPSGGIPPCECASFSPLHSARGKPAARTGVFCLSPSRLTHGGGGERPHGAEVREKAPLRTAVRRRRRRRLLVAVPDALPRADVAPILKLGRKKRYGRRPDPSRPTFSRLAAVFSYIFRASPPPLSSTSPQIRTRACTSILSSTAGGRGAREEKRTTRPDMCALSI